MLRIIYVGRHRLSPFTGTPIEKKDANTRAVFGDYIAIYDIQRAVADKATVPFYYESRISKLSLNAAELPKLDAEFEQTIPTAHVTCRLRQGTTVQMINLYSSASSGVWLALLDKSGRV